MGARSRPQGLLRDHDHSRAGEGGDTLDIGGVTADDVNIDDGDTLDFGTDDDYGIRYDAGDSRLELFSAAQGDFLRVADGGIAVTFPGDVTVQGTTTEVDDILTTDVFVEQTDGTDQIHLSGDTAPHFIRDLVGGMEIRGDNDNARITLPAGGNVRLGTGETITYPGDAGVQTLADMAVSGTPAAGTEESFSLAVDGSDVLKAYAEADGAGGVQNRAAVLENAVFLEGEDTGGSMGQLIGITGSDVVLVGDVAGLGLPTDIEAGGTTGISVQTGGNVNFDNGDVRINADGNSLEFGADQDIGVAYVAGNDALEWSDVGTSTRMQLDRTSGNLNIEGSLTEGAAL